MALPGLATVLKTANITSKDDSSAKNNPSLSKHAFCKLKKNRVLLKSKKSRSGEEVINTDAQIYHKVFSQSVIQSNHYINFVL